MIKEVIIHDIGRGREYCGCHFANYLAELFARYLAYWCHFMSDRSQGFRAPRRPRRSDYRQHSANLGSARADRTLPRFPSPPETTFQKIVVIGRYGGSLVTASPCCAPPRASR